MTLPFAATTLTEIKFDPRTNDLSPITETEALRSSATATNATLGVPGATVINSPSVTVCPLIVKTDKFVLLLKASTITVKVYDFVAPLAAVTATVTTFEPSCS